MPLQATSGAASYDAYGGGVAVVPTYIEDVFSCFLYTGNGSTGQSINNGIDLSTKGGLVWIKDRANAQSHALFDTNRGTYNLLSTNNTTQQVNYNPEGLTAFNTTGFSVADSGGYLVNTNTRPYASWTFRKQPKFFDVVTYTGTGVAGRTVAHSLGSTPACMIVKQTSAAGQSWAVYHRELGATKVIWLDLTNAAQTRSFTWDDTAPTSTVFTVGAGGETNSNGQTYVAYLFAHDAGGFGLTGTDNVISCGSFTPSGGVATINLGYEPQWILSKVNSAGYYWRIVDNMRGIPVSPPGSNTAKVLYPNAADAEASSGDISPTGTGFTVDGQPDFQTIYIAIRRGPMKVPTTGTSVFAPVTGNFSSPYTVTTNFPVDLTISSSVTGSTRAVNDRLRGGTTTSYNYLNTTTTAAESTGTGAGLGFQNNTAVIDNNWQTGSNAFWWNFRRAPSFFDEVCYTGTGSARTVAHNLTVVPELIFTKRRDNGVFAGRVYHKDLGPNYWLYLFYNVGDAVQGPSSSFWNGTAPTASVFSVGNDGGTNASGSATVAYLFATCAGVSKVGSYTGTGATQTIDCGFGASGSRFVLIKRTDSTGDWWVWDSARGMVSGTDPRIDLNAGNPQTNANWVYTISTGFQIVTTDASVNANGGTYIFLAIA